MAAKVYPNPAHDLLTVSMEDNKDIYSAQILDLLGRSVAAGTSNNGTIQIPTGSLPSGLYLVQIRNTQGNEMNTKVMIQH